MPSSNPFDARTKERAFSVLRSDTASRTPPKAITAIIWIAGILIVLAGGIVVWLIQARPTISSSVQRAPPDEPSPPPASAAPAPAAPAAAPPTPAPVRQVAPRGGASASPSPPIAIAAVPPVSGSPVEIKPPQAEINTPAVVPTSSAVHVEEARNVTPAEPVGLYSAADADVTPPEPIGQRWLNVVPAGLRPDEALTIDFIVNERGVVESAKVKGAPRSLAEAMQFTMSLQRLKSWQFRPALKDGDPVKYRESRSFSGTATELAPPK
jgi:hypothetical protein